MTYVIPKFEDEYHFLSNFHNSPITIKPANMGELVFPTGEHMFQALKYKAAYSDGSDYYKERDLKYVKQVISHEEPNWAKKIGRTVTIDTEKWDRIKIDMMRQTVWEKFAQHSDLRERLLDTGPAMLVEGNTWGDKFWGRVDGAGFNMLGCILMEVRGAYRWNGATQKWSG